MVRKRIHRVMFSKEIQVDPTNCPDAIGRKVDAGRKKRLFFSMFTLNLRTFSMRHQHAVLNEGRGYRVTSFRRIL